MTDCMGPESGRAVGAASGRRAGSCLSGVLVYTDCSLYWCTLSGVLVYTDCSPCTALHRARSPPSLRPLPGVPVSDDGRGGQLTSVSASIGV